MARRTALTEPHPEAELLAHGLVMPAPHLVYVDRTVDLDRLQPGAILCPGVRLSGAATFIGDGALIGSEGPATLVDCAVDSGAEFCSGFAEGAVLFRGAKLGGSAHVRPATILEESASTAHAVGLKQTVLMSFVALGSLINACDLLVAGGTSKDDHSEVGSGFIHFNFTPWGERGDKATPSLVGNVHEGAFLNRRRVFVGGLSGLVGPGEVGFGSVTAAGQVIRRKVGVDRLSASAAPTIDRPRKVGPLFAVDPQKLRANFNYIGQLCALRAWYGHVRLARVGATGDVHREVLLAGVRAIDAMIAERLSRLRQYSGEQRGDIGAFDKQAAPPVAFVEAAFAHRPELAHVDWVRSLDAAVVDAGVAWLGAVSADAAARFVPHFPAAG
jgi:UDP-N-acetylglucosamine/UDP-N-acetylgalactosamine diphosphorylase